MYVVNPPFEHKAGVNDPRLQFLKKMKFDKFWAIFKESAKKGRYKMYKHYEPFTNDFQNVLN